MPDLDRRLDGWKEIADHLKRAPRTVQGWERDFGLPVHRLQGRTYAQTSELDRWVSENRTLAATMASPPLADPSPVDLPPIVIPQGKRRWDSTVRFKATVAGLIVRFPAACFMASPTRHGTS